jgi:hypothetical protein
LQQAVQLCSQGVTSTHAVSFILFVLRTHRMVESFKSSATNESRLEAVERSDPDTLWESV